MWRLSQTCKNAIKFIPLNVQHDIFTTNAIHCQNADLSEYSQILALSGHYKAFSRIYSQFLLYQIIAF